MHDTVYVYDALNRLTAVANWGVYEAQYTYDVNGNRASVVYANGSREDYTYNKANWVTGLTNCSGGVVTSAYIYTYYASGNRQTELDLNGIYTAYTYDGLGRLTSEFDTTGLTISYAYDTAGNRTGMSVSGSENYTTTYGYDANNRLTAEVTTRGGSSSVTIYGYDANGNLLTTSEPNGAVINTYNDFNQLVSTSSGGIQTTYTYNAQGIRTSKTTANTTVKFLLDGGNVVGEVQSGVLTAAYLRGINLIRRVIMSGAEYYLFNGHGDVVGLTNSSGGVTKFYDYDAFGNEKSPDASDTNPFRYCGEYFDNETGTYYLRARYYDPEIGRFTQQDTHWSPANAIYGDNPRQVYERTDALGLSTYAYAPEISAIMQSGNLYVYAINNPITYCDLTGEALINIICAAVGALAGFGFGDYVAKSLKLEAWQYWAVRMGVTAGGAAIGWFAGTAITAVVSRYLVSNPGTILSLASKLGPATFSTAMNFLGIDPFSLITDSGKFHGLLQNAFNTPAVQIGLEWAKTLINKAQQFGISIRLDPPHDNAWNIWHLNVGKYHVGILPSIVDGVKELLGVG